EAWLVLLMEASGTKPSADHEAKALSSLGSLLARDPANQLVVPVGPALGRPPHMDGPAFARLGLQGAFGSQIAGCIPIDEEVKRGDALGDGDEGKALIAKRRPARNSRQRPSRKRAFDAFG